MSSDAFNLDPKLIWSTSNFPHSLLPAARLVGNTPFITCVEEHRASYTLHVPAAHYNPDPYESGQFHPKHTNGCLFPPYTLRRLPLVVVIHGSSRSAAADRDRLAATSFLGEQRHATLALLFPAGCPDTPNDWDAYKRVRPSCWTKETLDGDPDEELCADNALIFVLEDVERRWPGIDTTNIVLVGFSGGGSFALRFTLLHPGLVRAVSVGAPTGGSVVGKKDIGRAWPEGLEDMEYESLKNGMWKKARKVKWQLVVGTEDRGVEGSLEKIQKAVRSEMRRIEGTEEGPDWAKVEESMIKDRQKVLRDVQKGLAAHGVDAALEIVRGAGHNPDDVSSVVKQFVKATIDEYWAERE